MRALNSPHLKQHHSVLRQRDLGVLPRATPGASRATAGRVFSSPTTPSARISVVVEVGAAQVQPRSSACGMCRRTACGVVSFVRSSARLQGPVSADFARSDAQKSSTAWTASSVRSRTSRGSYRRSPR